MERSVFLRSTFRRVLPAPLLLLVSMGTTRADVALLRNGRSLSVTDYRKEGDRIRLLMEGGGEIALPNDQVIAIRHEAAPPLPPVTETPGERTDSPASPLDRWR